MKPNIKKQLFLIGGILLFLLAVYFSDEGKTGSSIGILMSFIAGYVFAIRHTIKVKEE